MINLYMIYEWKIKFGGDQGKDKRHHLDEQPFPDELELPSDE